MSSKRCSSLVYLGIIQSCMIQECVVRAMQAKHITKRNIVGTRVHRSSELYCIFVLSNNGFPSVLRFAPKYTREGSSNAMLRRGWEVHELGEAQCTAHRTWSKRTPHSALLGSVMDNRSLVGAHVMLVMQESQRGKSIGSYVVT